MQDREKQLFNFFKDDQTRSELLQPLILNIVNLEKQLETLQGLPLIEINPKDNAKQRITPAGRLYSQLTQQYNASIKTLLAQIPKTATGDDESPLRAYIKHLMKNEKEKEVNDK